jgi:hypothetical protein
MATKPSVKRHCAFCLKNLLNVLKCGGCKKRVYCSVDCQKKDWTSVGQYHKIWCKVNCCEEGVDWEVAEVPGKGLGMIALRDIPPLTRILVEKSHTWYEAKDNPLLADLSSKDESVEDTFKRCSFNRYPNQEIVVGFRISRARHSCYPNADIWPVEDKETAILYSKCQIKKGEEICINYQPVNLLEKSPFNPPTFLHLRSLELRQRKIVCPSDCICRSDLYLKVVFLNFLTAQFNCRDMNETTEALDGAMSLIKLYEDHPRLLSLKASIFLPSGDGFRFLFASGRVDENLHYARKLLHFVTMTDSHGFHGMDDGLSVLLEEQKLSESNLTTARLQRHCAFCLNESANIILCNGCHRRAYCSEGNHFLTFGCYNHNE